MNNKIKDSLKTLEDLGRLGKLKNLRKLEKVRYSLFKLANEDNKIEDSTKPIYFVISHTSELKQSESKD